MAGITTEVAGLSHLGKTAFIADVAETTAIVAAGLALTEVVAKLDDFRIGFGGGWGLHFHVGLVADTYECIRVY